MFGNINALSVNQYPTEGTAIKQADGGILHKYANLSQLSMWGGLCLFHQVQQDWQWNL